MLNFIDYRGLLVGAATFLIIGILHPVVIKMEYYWGKQSWWLLCLSGIISTIISLFVTNYVLSTIFGALAFSLFWGILEIFEQEKRVLKGWFPMNPKRKAYYDSLKKD